MTQNLVKYLLSHPSLGEAPAVLLFGGPCVTVAGKRLEVPEGSKRLLVFIALADGKVDRRYAAGALWPDGNNERAAGNLRSALWRLRGASIDLIDGDKQFLLLKPGTLVDVKVLSDWAERLAKGAATSADLRAVTWRTVAMDLLPGWYDDWVIFERERIRQRLLHALEALSRYLIVGGRRAEAVETAIVAVSADPLRETANRILIEAHLAEGNFVEARRAYLRYRTLVGRELGVEPGQELASLVQNGCGQQAKPGSGAVRVTRDVPARGAIGAVSRQAAPLSQWSLAIRSRPSNASLDASCPSLTSPCRTGMPAGCRARRTGRPGPSGRRGCRTRRPCRGRGRRCGRRAGPTRGGG
jgi:DNA-binding SARP family transcriptional activator